jgi:hypothetical protein
MDTSGRATDQRARPFGAALRAVVEVAFILFLFYANLLMGQYVRNAPPHTPLISALHNIATLDDFVIGLSCAVVGHAIFDALRRRL